MKWKVKFTVDGKEENETVINAGKIRDAAMKAHAIVVRPLEQQGRKASIWSLQQKEHAAGAST